MVLTKNIYQLNFKYLSFLNMDYYNLHGCRKLSKRIQSKVDTLSSNASVMVANQQLKQLFELGRVDDARKLFDKMPRRDEFTYNSMVSGYANAGRLDEAIQVFTKTPKKSSITWSALISGYSKNGHDEVFDLFWQMQSEGHRPSQYTLGSVLRLCSIKRLLLNGKQIHGYVIKTDFIDNGFVVTGLIDMYAKCLHVMEAEYLFKKMEPGGRNHVTWTALINGYSLNGDANSTIDWFRKMRTEGVEANQYTFPSVLTACGAVCDLRFGVQVHSCVFRGGFFANVFVQSALIDMYVKCGDLTCAREVFNSMDIDHVVSWNTMIVGYARHGYEEEALLLFRVLHNRDMEMDEFTFPSVLNAVALMNNDVKIGNSVHCLVIKTGFDFHNLVSNALVDMYAKQGHLNFSLEVFNRIEDKDIISWTSMVTGYARNGLYGEALTLFRDMRIAGLEPDQVVLSSILSSCTELALLEYGQQVHAIYIKYGLGSSLSVDNSLVAIYANCGCLEDAITVFDSMPTLNVISWTTIIIGFAQNGRGKESLQLYDEMIASGIMPDYITFIGLLFACSHAGLVDQGHQYFEAMVDIYGITPGPDHYACMIDLMARSGKMQEAEKLLNEMVVEPDATVWKSLLAACRIYGNVDLAKRAAKALFELEPQDAVPYIMLSHIYSAAGRYEDAATVRRLMKSRGVGKEPGCSWMEMNGKVDTFMSEDRSHPKANEVYSKVDDIMVLIKEAGYGPDLKFAPRDINEETKELGLSYHSEKLAVAFGLLYVPQGAPIRIFKNLRVCGDCHTAMKFISKVFQRHIILRDSNCFHHFKVGECSCADYW